MYKCNHCGRKFKEKCAHKCNTGFRKRHLAWEITDLTAGDFIHLSAIRSILTKELIPMFGAKAPLCKVSKEIGNIVDNYIK